MEVALSESTQSAAAGREPWEVSLLLVELARAVRAVQLYPEGHAAGEALLDRAWRVWSGDLDRHGPLGLDVRDGAFFLSGDDLPIVRGRLEELARQLEARGGCSLRVAAPLTASAFRTLVIRMAGGPATLAPRKTEAPVVARGDEAQPPLPAGPQQILDAVEGEKEPGRLAELLARPDGAVRRRAAKALAQIGSPKALDALAALLLRQEPGAAALGAFNLGASGSPAAVTPLLQGVERALRQGRLEVAREAVRALGQLGCVQAVPALEGLLARRALRRRRQLRELKLAATAALARLPGEEARAALARAARRGDTSVRRAAARALAGLRDAALEEA